MKAAGLNPRACDTMTDVSANLTTRYTESNEKTRLGTQNALLPRQHDRKGRKTADFTDRIRFGCA